MSDLSPKFVRWHATKKVFASECALCHAVVAYSPSPELLLIAEKAHLCTALRVPEKRPGTVRFPVPLRTKAG